VSGDYKRSPPIGEAFVYAAMTRIMARRLANAKIYQTVFLGNWVDKGDLLYGALCYSHSAILYLRMCHLDHRGEDDR
jgi:hypothetical protein